MQDVKIETFLKVVKFKSFTAAAEELHLTQPAVTQHIQKLEAYYGCKLIESNRRLVRMTEAGELLFNYLSLQQANELQFSKMLNHAKEPLCVGATLSIADYYLPQLLVGHLLLEEERIRVTVGNTPSLLEGLQSGKLDCAFVEGLFDASLLNARSFQEANFIAVVSAKHPMCGKKVTLEELHAYPLVLREPRSGTRELLENWLHQKNDTTQSFAQTVELGSFVLIKKLVASSEAVTFVYEAVVEKEIQSGSLVSLDLEGYALKHALHFIYRKGDPKQKQLEQFYQKACGNKNFL